MRRWKLRDTGLLLAHIDLPQIAGWRGGDHGRVLRHQLLHRRLRRRVRLLLSGLKEEPSP